MGGRLCDCQGKSAGLSVDRPPVARYNAQLSPAPPWRYQVFWKGSSLRWKVTDYIYSP